jgi:serine/threonine-protein kinase
MVSRELNEMAWHRFQRESDALKHLEHPNIVRFLDSFREEDFEYIVMEYVYGGSLFERLNREGRLPLAPALEIVMRLASALAHAHSRNIIHRDIKPSNTMLTADYSPRLADFGVARLNYDTRVTLPQTVIGTTPYLSPESCMGETSDARGDIWALGVMLYEMLAGTLPFVGRTDDLIVRAILEQPVPDLRKVRPEVPDEVQGLIERMLHKSPSHASPRRGRSTRRCGWRWASCATAHNLLHLPMQGRPVGSIKRDESCLLTHFSNPDCQYLTSTTTLRVTFGVRF